MIINTIRCCISCILPCGALDVIRIVHSNGRVEEIGGSITASEIMKSYPKHVLKKPSSPSDDHGVVPRIVIVPPDAELQRGKIYFLVPMPIINPTSEKSKKKKKKKKTAQLDHHHRNNMMNINNIVVNDSVTNHNLLVSDRYLSEILSEKLSTQRERRRGRVGVWRPNLESISEQCLSDV